MSTVWEDTNGFAKQYRCDLSIYLRTVLPSSYGFIMDCAINALGHRNNAFDGLNETERRFLTEQIKLIGKLASNDTSEVVILPSASKDVSINFSDQCIHILKNKEGLN